jgi:hypothetical protein
MIGRVIARGLHSQTVPLWTFLATHPLWGQGPPANPQYLGGNK